MYYDKFTGGGLFTRIFDDVGRVQNFITDPLGMIFVNASAVAFIGVVLVTLSPWLTLVALLPIPITFAAVLEVVKCELTIGTLIAFTLYMWQFYGPIFGLVENVVP